MAEQSDVSMSWRSFGLCMIRNLTDRSSVLVRACQAIQYGEHSWQGSSALLYRTQQVRDNGALEPRFSSGQNLSMTVRAQQEGRGLSFVDVLRFALTYWARQRSRF